MRTTKLFAGIVAASLALSGCSVAQKYSASDLMGAPSLQGKVTQVGKLRNQPTPITLSDKGSKLHVLFPELKNHMGKDFAATPCEATFDHQGSFENSANGTKVSVYQGSWPAANNNCALFVERRSAQYSSEESPRYVILERGKKGVEFIMSWDAAGRMPIVKGTIQ